MARPLQFEERQEVENLAYECETSPQKLRAYLLELVRLRNVVQAVKDCSRRPLPIDRALSLNVPRPSSSLQWIRMLDGAEDLETPIPTGLSKPLL